MTFPIGIISDCLRLPFDQAMARCAALGADGVQLYAVKGEMAPENLTPAQIAEKRRVIEGNGLRVSALCGDLGGHGFTRREENRDKIERSKRIVELALAMGTTVVTTHIGVVPAPEEEAYKVLQEACSQLAEYAHSAGAYFAVETGPEPAERLKSFLDSLSTPGVAVNLDPANLVMVAGDDPVHAVHTLKDYIVHTHAKDGIMLRRGDPRVIYGETPSLEEEGGGGDYYREVPLGEGGVHFDTYLKALEDIGYTGFLTIEREVGADPAGDISAAVGFLKGFMD